ncbi:hypothetical protein [Burkholderia contaminans]|uniref:hypothetical protein n=1 Tax=Burkholderia contaminans TaxID=488447 RepID=UPI000F58ED2A|nr:hypothetical protein [Burkholderia contaminans]RQT02080.1 hypothetical protein DF035_15305 [Burkholderia contaminans]
MPEVHLQPIVDQAWTSLHPLLTSVLSSTVITTALSAGLVTWITAKAKGRVDAHYAQTLEKLKADLKSDADTRLEALKSQLKSDADTKLETLKALLKSESDNRLEVHKATLKRSGDAEIEKLRAQLAAANAERTTLLAALTTRRFDAIKTIHAKLLKFHRALVQLTSPMRNNGADDQPLFAALVEASREFDESLPDNEIFLTEASARLVKEIRQQIVAHGNRFNYGVSLNALDPKRIEKWVEIDEAVKGPISEAIDDLARELRALMGDKPAALQGPNDTVAADTGGQTAITVLVPHRDKLLETRGNNRYRR